ncbi:hypothetical protein [Roseovarius sp.]
MTYLNATITPDWTRREDRRVDVSDVWQEQTDPNNERGEVCEAIFERVDVPCIDERHRCFDADGFTLIGIAITDECGTVYRDRAWALKMLGADAVWRVEDCKMEAV